MTAASATGIASRLAQGAMTSVALAQAALDRISAENDRDRIFISVMADAAIEAAQASDARRAAGHALGPLDGLPIAVKDNIDVAGSITTSGSRHDFGGPAGADASVVARLRAAGAVILGKLNLHEGALGATTDNPFWGRCENPAVPGHTPGGSSGGSGAVVAAGIVPIALGTDTMGSVRIPAAYCGLWGLKPTRGLVSTSGLHYLSWTLDTIGPLATSAADLALAITAMAGHDARDPRSAAAPAGWSAALGAAPSLDGITLGRIDAASLADCEPAVVEAYDALLDGLSRQGATLRSVTVEGWEPGKARRAGLLMSEAECGSLIGEALDMHPDRFSQGFRDMIAYGRGARAERLAKAYWLFDALSAAALAALSGVDAIVLPTAPQRAFPHGAPAPANQADFTALANIAGLPAVAFPLPAPDGGAPASAQLLGHPFSEGRLLSIAEQAAG
ncbi:amidase [Neoaquamicrobium sediminum]|uniref:amidase n=1 Tax=Neoaquamicrobium sediminum TaxID=1849104 RepID=UPI003BAB4875